MDGLDLSGDEVGRAVVRCAGWFVVGEEKGEERTHLLRNTQKNVKFLVRPPTRPLQITQVLRDLGDGPVGKRDLTSWRRRLRRRCRCRVVPVGRVLHWTTLYTGGLRGAISAARACASLKLSCFFFSRASGCVDASAVSWSASQMTPVSSSVDR